MTFAPNKGIHGASDLVGGVDVRGSAGRGMETPRWDHMEILDDHCNVDYGQDGQPNGVELLYISDGVNLDGLPQCDVIERLLAEHHIPVFA